MLELRQPLCSHEAIPHQLTEDGRMERQRGPGFLRGSFSSEPTLGPLISRFLSITGHPEEHLYIYYMEDTIFYQMIHLKHIFAQCLVIVHTL